MTEPIGRAARRAAERDKKRQTKMAVSGYATKNLANLINQPVAKPSPGPARKANIKHRGQR